MEMLHTSITVKDMERSIEFYTKNLGMKLERRDEIKQNNAEIAFLGIAGTDHKIELTWWRIPASSAPASSSACRVPSTLASSCASALAVMS